MAPRPAKRQRRSTIIVSDDSDEEYQLPTGPSKPAAVQREITLDGKTSATTSPAKAAGKGKSKTKPTATRKGKAASTTASPKSSPEKARNNTSNTDKSTRSLHSFFGKATEEERWRKKSATPDPGDWANGELDDAIEDDELSDETLQELGLAKRSQPQPQPQPPAVKAKTLRSQSSTRDTGNLSSSQRFFKTAPAPSSSQPAHKSGTGHVPEVQYLPWADRYGPSNLDELVVHKKKVSNVQGWLQGKISGRNNQKVLVLKGPAGSGKTTTLSLLAKAMGLQLVTWHNPAVSELGTSTSSIAHQFEEFLNRGGRFGSLVFDNDQATDTASSQRVLVVEEFPATISRQSSALQSFRSVILQFLARSKATPSGFSGTDNLPPLVMIISETLLSSATAISDSFTAHRLLGPEILNHPFVTVMEFNPVASTFVTKALDLVMQKEARDSLRRRVPGPAVIQRLAEMGDVRSAVNSLEFLCVRGSGAGGSGSADWSGTVAVTAAAKTKKKKDSAVLTEMEKNSLQIVTRRETTLDMFHAAGKVVYNKREDPCVLDTRAEPPPKPPDHMMHLYYKSKASQVDIEALFNETGTDIHTFISTLHQNYILSCNGDTFEESFDGCADVLSTTDVLDPESRPALRRATGNPNASLIQANLQTGSSDTLRQDEIGFHVATRGLLFNLPYPVNRASPPNGKKGDAFKMFYPASLRLWKPMEEMDSLIDLFVHDSGVVARGATLSSGVGDHGVITDGSTAGTGVASWQTRAFGPPQDEFGKSHGDDDGKDHDDDGGSPPDEDEDTPPRPVHRPKITLVCEILPYMARIMAARNQDVTVLERITRFKPEAFLSQTAGETEGDDVDEDAGTVNESVNTAHSQHRQQQQQHLHQSSSARDMGNGIAGHGGPGAAAAAVEKLYISDDDIEDD
ncbi:cell cycle checkpoint protein [Exophiala dermatitidis NIH/UT8656]|uniref:Cell cycle checkpoint protein n=1 Tax=Exophiala dermatitidis (strain ATCC 34100 / CBS 525.76 / NIH/UT8656) TaxID=858893 RepID=H6C2E0_EXODN|nr:cell cycle checkpoint protein [Exophiala dermatitidis NIH/UT8656]EHY57912.1 cell cycle checkpoint protein [Exophiala dermatitidis NIH/UT8656]